MILKSINPFLLQAGAASAASASEKTPVTQSKVIDPRDKFSAAKRNHSQVSLVAPSIPSVSSTTTPQPTAKHLAGNCATEENQVTTNKDKMDVKNQAVTGKEPLKSVSKENNSKPEPVVKAKKSVPTTETRSTIQESASGTPRNNSEQEPTLQKTRLAPEKAPECQLNFGIPSKSTNRKPTGLPKAKTQKVSQPTTNTRLEEVRPPEVQTESTKKGSKKKTKMARLTVSGPTVTFFAQNPVIAVQEDKVYSADELKATITETHAYRQMEFDKPDTPPTF